MRGGDPATMEMDYEDFPTYHNDACKVRFPRDGNWATQNGFSTGGWDANQNSQCQGDGPASMTYHLQSDGNFVAYCGALLDYTTHTGQGIGPGNYVLLIDDACILHLWKGTFDCDGIHLEEEIWTNIRNVPLKNGDRLGKGEMVRHGSTTLVMQSSDGNLVLYNDTGSTDVVLWAANDEWSGPPTPMYHEFYAKITYNGHLQLVGREFQYGTEMVYFEKYLGIDSGCFTMEYDGVGDLVARACP